MFPKQQFVRVPIENSYSTGFASYSESSLGAARVNPGTSSTSSTYLHSYSKKQGAPVGGRSHIKYSQAPTRGSDDTDSSFSECDSAAEEAAAAANDSHSSWDLLWSLPRPPARRSRSSSRSGRSVSHTHKRIHSQSHRHSGSSTARVGPSVHSELSSGSSTAVDDSGFAPDTDSRAALGARAPPSLLPPAYAMTHEQNSSIANPSYNPNPDPNYPYPRQQPPYSGNGNGSGINAVHTPSPSRNAISGETRPVSVRLASARRKARLAGRRLKHWETFPGRNRFCFGGQLMQSKKPGAFYITLSLVIIISALYFGFECAHICYVVVMSIVLLYSIGNPNPSSVLYIDDTYWYMRLCL